MPIPFPITTIGYEKAGFADFARTLRQAGVTRVLDVRDLPLSRRAGFSKRQLAAGLGECGIAYTHLKGLGTPKPGRDAAKAKRMAEFHAIFAAHMATDNAQTELRTCAELVQAEPCCLLCFEAESTCCHRSVIAAALVRLTGMAVKNLRVEI